MREKCGGGGRSQCVLWCALIYIFYHYMVQLQVEIEFDCLTYAFGVAFTLFYN